MNGIVIRRTKKGYRIVMVFDGKGGVPKCKFFLKKDSKWDESSSGSHYFESKATANVCLILVEENIELGKEIRSLKFRDKLRNGDIEDLINNKF